MPPTVAIVLSGAFRTLTSCNQSVVEHVIQANPEMRFHVYAHLTIEASSSEAERDQAAKAVWGAFPCVVGAALETDAQASAAVRKDLPFVDRLPRGRGTARGKAMNIIKMFRGISIAQQLVSLQSEARGGKYGLEGKANFGRLAPPPRRDGRCGVAGSPHPPRTGYDLILRLRPDLCFCGALDLSPMVAHLGGRVAPLGGSSSHLWLPWWSVKVGWGFDQIAVGTTGVMASYATAYHTTVRRLVAAGTELYPEAVMWAHLSTLGGFRSLRTLRGFRASLARSQPRLHLTDPYTKLKQDMAIIQPSEVAESPIPLPSPSPSPSTGAMPGHCSLELEWSTGRAEDVVVRIRALCVGSPHRPPTLTRTLALARMQVLPPYACAAAAAELVHASSNDMRRRHGGTSTGARSVAFNKKVESAGVPYSEPPLDPSSGGVEKKIEKKRANVARRRLRRRQQQQQQQQQQQHGHSYPERDTWDLERSRTIREAQTDPNSMFDMSTP